MSPQIIQRIQNEREKMGKFYPKIEEKMLSAFAELGNKELLRLMTGSETREFLKKKIIPQGLASRKEGHVYLFTDGKERVFTQKEIIRRIKEEFFTVPADVSELRGTVAYSGIVKGTVFTPYTQELPEKGILVTHMTKPSDIELIKKCVAIVTDEGGILCHAAVIAREMKKPCIIGTKIATKVLKDGDMVEVDATERGIVKILKRY